MDKREILRCIDFFNKLKIVEIDCTSESERNNGQLVVIVKYHFENVVYTTNKLYYRDIQYLENIKYKDILLAYFQEPVYWLDIDKHAWPQGSGESDLEEIVINDMAPLEDTNFKSFMYSLANNDEKGFIQCMTSDGRSAQYYHNLENNNHWHDIINLIKAIIDNKGNEVNKKFFSRLIFKWDGDKNSIRERSTLTNKAYSCSRSIVECLYKNIKSIQMEMNEMEIIKLLQFKKQIILQGPPGTGKTFTAKKIADKIIFGDYLSTSSTQHNDVELSSQYKIIQFHPSYAYEDFVRGITAKANGNQVEYKTINKVFAEFAFLALNNYIDSKKTTEVLSKEKWLYSELHAFSDTIQTEIETNGLYALNERVSIFEIENDAFRYGGNNWDIVYRHRMKFSDIILEQLNNVANRQAIKELPGISGRAKEHSSYDFKLLERFRLFLGTRPPFIENNVKVDLENYVLIIDEINRANLPSVLGELIYALEYRGAAVDSMYEYEGDKKLIIPPNLYIIGTMNTADRSVGHIDYAIKRRFAFVDILPSNTVIDEVITDSELNSKAKSLFEAVAKLFNEEISSEMPIYLQSDFKAKDVQLGHSYFLANTESELRLKLDYEIKPILLEYIKDGVLSEDARKVISDLKIHD